jgi:hypothetical protein
LKFRPFFRPFDRLFGRQREWMQHGGKKGAEAMPTRLNVPANAAPYDLEFTGTPYGELSTGEQVCPPSRNVCPRNSWGSAFLVLMILGVGGAGIAKLPDTWRASIIERAADVIQLAFAPSEQHPPPAQVAAAMPEPLPQHDVLPAAGAEAGTLVSEQPSDVKSEDSVSAQEDPAGNAVPEPLDPPVADPAEPLQKRALAAGLHPDLSRAVLARFSETDWSNAAHAVRTALVSSRDAQVTWPKAATRDRAQFEVRFVRAASAACRRYVVSVILDRWSATASAMELCGDALPKREAGPSSTSKRGG